MKEKIRQAIEIWGRELVAEVVSIVRMVGGDDADGVYSNMQDMGMDEHAEIVEFLYFNN